MIAIMRPLLDVVLLVAGLWLALGAAGRLSTAAFALVVGWFFHFI